LFLLFSFLSFEGDDMILNAWQSFDVLMSNGEMDRFEQW
jgi:hypothetical protein